MDETSAIGNAQPKMLKAYEVYDGSDGWAIVFATNSASARREGASDIGTDWEGVDFCRRLPEADKYAPGPVPPLARIEMGWWYECTCCGRRVNSDLLEEVEDDGLDPSDFGAIAEGQRVYCSRACAAREAARGRRRAAAISALIELFESKFEDCAISSVHVCDDALVPSEPYGGAMASIDFMFPGAKYGATYIYGDANVRVAMADVDAYYAWRGGVPPAQNVD